MKLTPKEACVLTGIKYYTLSKWAREGKIPHEKTPAGQRRYDSEQLIAHLKCKCPMCGHKGQ